MADDKEDPRLGTVLQGRYRVLSRLAAGGMGTVYRGERIQLGRPVAIKFLHTTFASEKEFLRRFEVEARAMSRLSHPHCVSVIDFGVEGAPYMVMDFVQGDTLRTILDRGRMTPPRAVTILRQILAGLAHAHGQGIVHRDVKPANIILGEATGTGDHARILDFGLAKLRDSAAMSDQSVASMAVGTPSYMAPEQIRGEKVDGRADVYACGVLLFELITGKKMFTADETFEILRMHLEAKPQKIGEAAPDLKVSSELEEALARSLQKKPDDRFQTAAEFADALEATVEAHQALRPRPSTQVRAQMAQAEEAAPVAALPYAATQAVPSSKQRVEAKPAPESPSPSPEEEGRTGASLAALAAAATRPADAESNDAVLPPPPRLRTAPPAPLRPSAPRPAAAPPPPTPRKPISVPPATSKAVAKVEPASVDSSSELVRSGSYGGGGRAIGFLALLVAGAGGAWWYMHAREDVPPRPPRNAQSSARNSAMRKIDAGIHASETPQLLPDAEAPHPDASAALPPDAPAAAPSPPDAPAAIVQQEEEEDEKLPDAAPNEVLPPDEQDEPIAPVPEAATTPEEQIDPPSARAPKAPSPTTRELSMNEVLGLIRAGKREEAVDGLLILKKKNPKSAYFPYLLGNLYFDKGWWTDGMEMYQLAIRLNRGYRWRGVLIRNAVHALGSEKTKSKAITVLRRNVGSPALPYLRRAAKHDPNGKIRERSSWLAKVMGGGGRRRRGRFH